VKTTLTSQQKKLLKFITEHIRQESRPPTVREIGSAFGFRSTGTVRDHLQALRHKGYLRPAEGKARGLIPRLPPLALPILGRVPAGGPLLADENIEGTIDLSSEFSGDKVFALKVVGDSMIDDGIHEGDLVVVRSQDSAESGQIVVAHVDGEATVKRLVRKNGKLWLQPANARYEPILVAGETRILGRAIGIIRSYDRKF
jgi:repressor LexA